MSRDESAALLRVEGLRVSIASEEGRADVVAGVDLRLAAGETLALVGESGCGKSLSALALIGLLPGAAEVAAGHAWLDGQDLFVLSPGAWRSVRGADIAMVFQESATSLNPVLTVGEQVAEVLRLHAGLGRAAARARAIELLGRVGLPDPTDSYEAYPHLLSGGMRQRVSIAAAMACQPRILIADEPTTALDVTVQAQVLELLAELQRETGTAMLLITHDLGVVAECADRVAVMYAGRIVEEASVEQLFEAPSHPYTRGLLASLLSAAVPPRADGDLPVIEGRVPSPFQRPTGCAFRTRCALARQACAASVPALAPVLPLAPAVSQQRVACPFHAESEPAP